MFPQLLPAEVLGTGWELFLWLPKSRFRLLVYLHCECSDDATAGESSYSATWMLMNAENHTETDVQYNSSHPSFQPHAWGAPVLSTPCSTLANTSESRERMRKSISASMGPQDQSCTNSKHSTFLTWQGLETLLQLTKCSQVCASLDPRELL